MKKLKILSLLAVLALVFTSCGGSDTNRKINKVGETAGEAVGELVSGVTSGVEKAYEPTIELSPALKDRGIEFGKILVSSDKEGNDNLLQVYMIFNKDFKGTLTAKAFDSKGLEMGRARQQIDQKKEDAKYIEFHFDKRTNIDKDSKLTIEL
jgi:hypothetical protein